MLISFYIVLLSFLNRVRGGGFYGNLLPSRALFWVTVAVFLLAALIKPLIVAGALAVAYLFWGIWPWGYLQTFGRLTVEQVGRKVSDLETMLLYWTNQNYYLALMLRHLFVLPGLILTMVAGGSAWLIALALVFAVLVASAYKLAWRLFPHNPIWVAELATGALWGALIVI